MKNRMWLLGIAKHELYKSLMPTDTATLKSTMTAFEKDMRKEKSWPFEDPETLSLFFSAWLGKHLTPQKSTPEKSQATPWTPQQWQIITEIVPDLIRVRFETIGRQIKEELSNDWSLGYVWGYFSAWIKEMPRQTIEAGAPELYSAGFEAVFGATGPAAITRCVKELPHTGKVSAGAASGETDARSDIKVFESKRR